MTEKERVERLAKLVRIEAIVRQHFDRSISAAQRKRFMETGTFCPDKPAAGEVGTLKKQFAKARYGVRTHRR